MQKPICRHCSSDQDVKLRRKIIGSGATVVYWYCVACGKGAERNEPAIKKETVNAYLQAKWGKTVYDIPIAEDQTSASPPCVVCGRTDTELNHWMPRMFAERTEVAPDWAYWANITAPLCRYHHAIWHAIVTPYMPGLGRNNGHDREPSR